MSNKLKLMKKEKNKELDLINRQRSNTPHIETSKRPQED